MTRWHTGHEARPTRSSSRSTFTVDSFISCPQESLINLNGSNLGHIFERGTNLSSPALGSTHSRHSCGQRSPQYPEH